MSFRLKTILGIAAIEAVLLALLIFLGIRGAQQLAEDALVKYAGTTAAMTASMIEDALVATDLASLQRVATSVAANTDVVYLRILDNDRILASAGSPSAGQFRADSRVDIEADPIYDMAHDVVVAGRQRGRLELGLDVTAVGETIASSRRRGVVIALLEMTLVAAFSWVLGTYLTRQLANLTAGARRVAKGDFSQPVPVHGRDEVASAALAFNHMTERLQSSDAELREALAREADKRRKLMDNEHALARQRRLIEAVGAIQSAYIEGRHPQETCQLAVQRAAQLGDAGCAFLIELVHESAGEPVLAAGRLTVEAHMDCPAKSWESALKDMSAWLLQECQQQGHVLIDRCGVVDPAFENAARELPMRGLLAMPIRLAGSMVGVICLVRGDQAFDPSTVADLEPLVRTLGQLLGAYQAESRRREAVAALEASEVRYKAAFGAVAQSRTITPAVAGLVERAGLALASSVARLGWGQRDPDTGLSYWDDTMCDILGYVGEESMHTDDEFVAMVHPDDRPLFIAKNRELLCREVSFVDAEFRIVRPDGEVRILAARRQRLARGDGQRDSLLSVASDVTEQRGRQAEVERLLAELDAIFSLSPDGFAFFDSASRLTVSNPALESMLGHDSFALRGMTAGAFDTLVDSLRSKGPMAAAGSDVLQLARPRPQTLKRAMRVVRGADGVPIGKVLYLRDITHESEVDRLKSDFLSSAAHELRTPMASIQGFSELLLTRRFDDEQQRDLIGTIHRQSQTMSLLVNELLDLARIDERAGRDLCIGSHDLEPLLTRSLDAIRLPGLQHELCLELAPALSPVDIDPEKFAQVMSNVLSNACKYSPGKGRITIIAGAGEGVHGNQVGVHVTDTGIGMSEEQQARVFERFYRADNSGAVPGTGLGMALVHEIMHLMGGEVALRSAPGAGTTVSLWLSASQPANVATAAS